MKKRLLISVLLVLALTLCCATAFADDSLPPPDQISENPFYAETVWRYLPRTDDFHLTLTQASIAKASSTSISGRGYSEVNQKANMVGGTMIFQQWKNNQWNDYYSVLFMDYDTYACSSTKTITVEPGYYYRLIVIHRSIAYDGSISYTYNTTKSIYVN